MTRPLLVALALLCLAACAGTSDAPPVPPAALADLAPTGKLRAVINYGNPVLAKKDAAGEPAGVSVDLARELARRLGVPVELVTVPSAGQSVETLKAGRVDVGFFAIDPLRGVDTAFTAAYVQIEGAYLVRDASPLRVNDEVDRDGIRVAVGLKSAYDLYLTRELKKAKIVRVPTSPAVVNFFIANNLDVAAGVKQQLEMDAKRVPGLRLLPGRFMVINQAMGMRRGREAGAKYLAAFVEEMKASGFVAEALRRHAVEGALVAPPGGEAAAAAPRILPSTPPMMRSKNGTSGSSSMNSASPARKRRASSARVHSMYSFSPRSQKM